MSVHMKMRHTKISHLKKRKDCHEKSVPWREAFQTLIQKHSEGGLILKGFRSHSGVTQKELAKALHISQHHISEMENGKRAIGKDIAKRFAKFFKTDYRVFL